MSDTIDRIHGSSAGRISVYVGPSGLVPERRDARATEHSIRQMRMAIDLARSKNTGLHARRAPVRS